MRIIVDTNVLVRSVVRDDVWQAAASDEILSSASSVAIAIASFCEFVWVLRSAYGFSNAEITLALQAFLDVGKVVTDRPAVKAGLAFLGAGGDFADGVIAYEGKWLSGETFVSFDRRTVKVATANGYSAQWLT